MQLYNALRMEHCECNAMVKASSCVHLFAFGDYIYIQIIGCFIYNAVNSTEVQIVIGIAFNLGRIAILLMNTT